MLKPGDRVRALKPLKRAGDHGTVVEYVPDGGWEGRPVWTVRWDDQKCSDDELLAYYASQIEPLAIVDIEPDIATGALRSPCTQSFGRFPNREANYMIHHEHDWRRQPDTISYSVDKDGNYLIPLRCVNCDDPGWGKTSSLLQTWPKWEGEVEES
jgi:hypothetical protein